MRTLVGQHISALWAAGGPFIGPDGKIHGRVTVQEGTGDVLHLSTAAADLGPPYSTSQVRALYARYGFVTDEQIRVAVQNPPPLETATERIARNVNELNSGLRTWAGLETSIRNLPGAIVPTTASNQSRGPVRWFQDVNNTQTETEIPNIQSVDIARSVDQDAGTCKISLYNQQMLTTGQSASLNELGQPGYYTPKRGDTLDARARWTQSENSWHNKLVPNAIIRTYQGYGGNSKTIAQAIADGNLVLTGIWFVDSVTTGTDGMMQINARDPMKLLLEQQLYPPLVPSVRYPLKYYRWQYVNQEIRATAHDVNGVVYDPIIIGADAYVSGVGYFTTDGYQDVDAFGDAREHPRSGGTDPDPLSAATTVRGTKAGAGYYVMSGSGRITCYGDAVHHGDPFSSGYVAANGLNGVCIDMALTYTGNGYWVLDNFGHTFAFGDATVLGSQKKIFVAKENQYLSIESHPSKMAYWVLDAKGQVYCWPDQATAGLPGQPQPNSWTPALAAGTNDAVCLRRTATGNGYWIMGTAGQVQAFGDATAHGNVVPTTEVDWQKKYWKLIPQTDGGYLQLRGDGALIPFGTTNFYGDAIPGGQSTKRLPGNYVDYTDVVRDLVLWSGFLLQGAPSLDGKPPVYGNLESTGAFSPEPLPDSMFDKKPVIDALHQIKEVVGYFMWCDDEGAFRFESPNWWSPGNFNELGQHLATVPEIDERVQLTSYSVTVDDDSLRSEIIISSEDPDQAGTSTITTRIRPSDAADLRGLVKPAMWVNGFFQSKDEQRLMAELIALHIHFQSRLGQVQCVANPVISIGDQVRIWERQTSETYIHYIRGMTTHMDLDTGEYTMTLQTNWLGDLHGWGVSTANSFTGADWSFRLSTSTSEWLQQVNQNPVRFPLSHTPRVT